MSLTRITTSETGPFYASGSISFSSLRTNFKKTSSGSIKISDFRRNTNVNTAEPIVPDCTENRTSGPLNNGISASSNLKLSQFRNSIKYYDLTQGSGTDLNLNIAASSLWNSNLQYNIEKRVYLSGTSGSTTTSTPAASLNAAAVYNVLLLITGVLLGDGGTGGTAGGNGGNGGDALYINTNGTGTVTVRTSGASAQVYGGGGGGGGGGKGGKGGDAQYNTYYSYYISIGGGSVTNGSSTYYIRCQQACANVGGEWANNCYKHISEGGQNCGGNTGDYWSAVCYSDDATRVANTTACRKTVTGTTVNNSTGGAGGAAVNGGNGRGYLQSKSDGQSYNTGLQGGTNAGTGGNSGIGGNGGDWGEGGSSYNGGNGVRGSDGTQGSSSITTAPNFGQTDGPVGGGLGGAAGAAVAGSGYTIDSNGVDSAYKGSK